MLLITYDYYCWYCCHYFDDAMPIRHIAYDAPMLSCRDGFHSPCFIYAITIFERHFFISFMIACFHAFFLLRRASFWLFIDILSLRHYYYFAFWLFAAAIDAAFIQMLLLMLSPRADFAAAAITPDAIITPRYLLLRCWWWWLLLMPALIWLHFSTLLLSSLSMILRLFLLSLFFIWFSFIITHWHYCHFRLPLILRHWHYHFSLLIFSFHFFFLSMLRCCFITFIIISRFRCFMPFSLSFSFHWAAFSITLIDYHFINITTFSIIIAVIIMIITYIAFADIFH